MEARSLIIKSYDGAGQRDRLRIDRGRPSPAPPLQLISGVIRRIPHRPGVEPAGRITGAQGGGPVDPLAADAQVSQQADSAGVQQQEGPHTALRTDAGGQGHRPQERGREAGDCEQGQPGLSQEAHSPRTDCTVFLMQINGFFVGKAQIMERIADLVKEPPTETHRLELIKSISTLRVRTWGI